MSEKKRKTKTMNRNKLHKKADRRKTLVLSVLALVLMALLGSFAWYLISSRRDIYSREELSLIHI